MTYKDRMRVPTRSLPARFLRLGFRRQALLVEASSSLAAARIQLALFPFSRVARRIGSFAAPVGAEAEGQSFAGGAPAALEIAWAVRAAARRVPFRALCLEQAIAARSMLCRRGIATILHLGAGMNETNQLSAHAWLEAAGARVTGYPVASHIVEVGSFR